MKQTLVVMAAGIGSRYGAGIRQLKPVGPHGEIIMDYSIHDAIQLVSIKSFSSFAERSKRISEK